MSEAVLPDDPAALKAIIGALPGELAEAWGGSRRQTHPRLGEATSEVLEYAPGPETFIREGGHGKEDADWDAALDRWRPSRLVIRTVVPNSSSQKQSQACPRDQDA